MRIAKKITGILTAMVCAISGFAGVQPLAADTEDTDTYEGSENTFIAGDVSENGEIDLHDAILIAESILPANKDLNEKIAEIGDYNGDGKCTIYDMIDICKYLMNEQPVPSDSCNTFVDVPGAGVSVGSAVNIGAGTVTLPLTIEGNLTSRGCIISIKYDESLTFKRISGPAASYEAPGEVKAAVVQPTGMNTNFSSIEFECPDTFDTYNIDVTVYCMDCDGNYVANPVGTGGTIKVFGSIENLTYKLIDTEDDGKYEGVEITGCDESATEINIPGIIENVPAEIGSLPVISIADSAFSGRSELESVTLPDSITKISNCVFKDCYSLAKLTIPDSVTSIEYAAFKNCYRPKNIIIPDSVTNIGYGAFYSCESITDITIPEGVTFIDYDTFYGCESLESITIKNPECEIGDSSTAISDTATIYGYKNSTAQEYAEKYNRTFVALDEEPPVTTPAVTTDVTTTTTTVSTSIVTGGITDVPPEYVTTHPTGTTTVPVTTEPVTTTEPELPGDISGNGKIDLYDAIEICRSIMGMRTFTDEEKAIADYDGNGVVDLYDAIGIAKKLLEK